MSIKDIYGNDCATLYALSIVSGKWRLPILWKLYKYKVLRFNELKKEVTGISNIVLTQCLKDFENNKILKRTQYETIPPKVEYSLTKDGINLISLLEQLNSWGENQLSKTTSF